MALRDKYGLTVQERIFCDEYLVTGNAKASYFKAFKTCKKDSTAESNSTKLLQREHVKRYIEAKNDRLSNSKIATIDQVKEFWTNVLLDKNETMQNRLRASEFLAKTYGQFITKTESKVKTEVTGNINNPMENLTEEQLLSLIKATESEKDGQETNKS